MNKSLFLKFSLLMLLSTAVRAEEVAYCSDVVNDGVASNVEVPMGRDKSPWCVTPPPPPPEKPAPQVVVSSKTITPEVVHMDDVIPPVHFKKGKFDIDTRYIETLQKVFDQLRARTDIQNLQIQVTGHTDNDPIIGSLKKRIPDNWVLSKMRAAQVAGVIASELNLKKDEIRSEGYADTQPVASNATADGKTLNRRVEINIVYEMVKPKETVVEVAVTTPTAPVPPKAPRQICQPALAVSNGKGVRLSVDGMPVSVDTNQSEPPFDQGLTDAEAQRCEDVRLSTSTLSVQAEPTINPMLNVTASPDGVTQGHDVRFTPYWNYNSWIDRAEIRIFAAGDTPRGKPLVVVPVPQDRVAVWMPTNDFTAVQYVLRVYDKKENFDETQPKLLKISRDIAINDDETNPPPADYSGYGKNHIAVQNIPKKGSMVTVSGTVPPDAATYVMDQSVPVDADGRFVSQEIFPPGVHDYVLRVEPKGATPVEYRRPVYVPQNEFFYVALADIIVGGNKNKGPAALVTQDTQHYNEKTFVDGRLAMYLKGKIKGDVLLTAMADTQEQPFKDLFTNFAEKDPRYLLRRLDPDKYYPVYGDDSTMIEDAPTQGKFYVRLEKNDSYILWGNSHATLLGNSMAQIDRTIYGGKLHVTSPGATSFGERYSQLDAFVAEPDTVYARDEFRGTGGSLYYLQHLDITAGSERVRVEIRDKDSGLVIAVRDLSAHQDYEIDYLQGRVILSQPLASTGGVDDLVRSGDISGHPAFLVVRYEYVPGLSRLNDMAAGARVQQWLGDYVKLGAVVSRQRQEGSGNQDLLGGDLTLRLGSASYIKGEVGQTEGVGSQEFRSIDGGFGFSAVDQDRSGRKAQALRAETGYQLSDLFGASWRTRGTGYYETREAGFSAPGKLTDLGIHQWGTTLIQPLWTGFNVNAKYDESKENGGAEIQTLAADVSQQFSRNWTMAVGVRSDWRENVAASTITTSAQVGTRHDVGGKLTYASDSHWSAYGFGQATVEKDATRSDNRRYGLGLLSKITSKLEVGGEGSINRYGGFAGKVTSDYRINDRSSVYLGYLLESDRVSDASTTQRNGTLTTGTRLRLSDYVSVYGEEKWIHGDGPSGLTHGYGTNLTPNDRWDFGISAEHGTLQTPGSADLERTAGTLSAGYHFAKTKWASSVQLRSEESAGDRRTTFLFRNDWSYQMDPSWRLLTKMGFSFSNSSKGDFYRGDFTEGILGLAYRPVTNDRWNTLFKYTYFDDLTTPGQLGANQLIQDFRQRSHVGSVDTTWDVTKIVSLGGKYGIRLSQLQDGRTGGPWYQSTAHLGIVRTDWHIIRYWDGLVEGRVLHIREIKDTRSGALLAIYRHLNENLKLGAGYNFTDYSDDLTDLSYSSRVDCIP